MVYAALELNNETDKPLTVSCEPWGMIYQIAPHKKGTVFVDGDQSRLPAVAYFEDHLSIWGNDNDTDIWVQEESAPTAQSPG